MKKLEVLIIVDRNTLGSKKLDELRKIARAAGVKSPTVYKKSELIELILMEKSEKNEDIETSKEVKVTKEAIIETVEEETLSKPVATIRQQLPQKVKDNVDSGDMDTSEGILELTDGEFGFLRCENYLSGTEDIYVSPTQIRRFHLRTGDKIYGLTRAARVGEKYKALIFVKKVNGEPPETAIRRPRFESLTPIYPEERISDCINWIGS